jgi:hypothetical protein
MTAFPVISYSGSLIDLFERLNLMQSVKSHWIDFIGPF